MAKHNKSKTQQFLSPERYIRQKARTRALGKCYKTDGLTDVGEGYVIVTRVHNGGRVSMACFLIDTYCLGVKDSFYRLRMEDYELEDFLRQVEAEECPYEEAHNLVYGAVDFAEEAGIAPDKSFSLTQYMLEEDTDEIPLIEYDFGRDGKHLLVAHSRLELNTYLPLLERNLGVGNFEYILDDEDD